DVAAEKPDRRSEDARAFFHHAVHHHRLDLAPGGVRPVGLALATRDVDDLVSRFDQPRNQIGPDVAATPYDDDFRHTQSSRLCWSILRSARRSSASRFCFSAFVAPKRARFSAACRSLSSRALSLRAALRLMMSAI